MVHVLTDSKYFTFFFIQITSQLQQLDEEDEEEEGEEERSLQIHNTNADFDLEHWVQVIQNAEEDAAQGKLLGDLLFAHTQ